MGVKGNGKGRPLVKEGSSEVEDGEDDADDYEEEQAEEERFERSTFGTTPTLRDRSQLKKPSYAEPTDDGEDPVEDDYHSPAKRAKGQSRSSHKGQVSSSMDTSATSSSGQLGQVDALKTESEPHSPYDLPIEESSDGFPNSNSSPVEPIVGYFGIQGDTDDNAISFNNHFFSNDLGNYSASAYQPFAPQLYAAMQPLAQQQLTYPHELDAMRVDATSTFVNDSSGTDPFSSDPVTDETDVPEGFRESEWYNNYMKQTPQP